MDGDLPLPALLSQPLVAFVIEFDNEFEHQMPHRTTTHGSTPGSPNAPWLVSMVMWANFLRFVPADGIPIAELRRLLRIDAKSMRNWLTRMGKWWGYVVVESNKLVRPTIAGRQAQAVWQPLADVIEQRWRTRFGDDAIDQLRESLWELAGNLNIELPDSLPILGYGLYTSTAAQQPKAGLSHESSAGLSLPALLSKVLFAFAIEFERDSPVSLAISANVLRLVGNEGVRVRDLPRFAGVSKEAVVMSLNFLKKRGYSTLQSQSFTSSARVLALTPKGRYRRQMYGERVQAIEDLWQQRFGSDTLRRLRELLASFVGEPLFRGLEPYPGGWRASLPKPRSLPHYPMILHRGGFPDGS
jgi:DNA-binding MarR family transcriptional regulator